jgi:hypothetical protein
LLAGTGHFCSAVVLFHVRFFFLGPCSTAIQLFFCISGFACRNQATVQCCSFACPVYLAGTRQQCSAIFPLHDRLFARTGQQCSAVQLFFACPLFLLITLQHCNAIIFLHVRFWLARTGQLMQCSFSFFKSAISSQDLATFLQCSYSFHVQLCLPGLGNSAVQLFFCVSVFCNSSFPD